MLLRSRLSQVSEKWLQKSSAIIENKFGNCSIFVIASTAVAAAPLLSWWLWRQRIRKDGNMETERFGGELVAQVLKAHGVKFIFTLVGGHVSPILVASRSMGVRVIDVRHEATAVFAADAVSRLSETIGVSIVTAGPGITNTVTALKNCQMAQSSVLVIGGAAATMLRGRGALQDIDQLELMRPLCKFVARCNRVKDIVPTRYQAIKVSQSDVPGPVFVEIPIDLLYPIAEIKANCGLLTRIKKKNFDQPTDLHLLWVPQGHNKLVYLDSRGEDQPVFLKKKDPRLPFWLRMALRWRIQRLFVGGFSSNVLHTHNNHISPLKQFSPRPKPQHLERVAHWLQRVNKPLILVGSQCTLHDTDHLAAALKKLGIPVFLAGGARGLLGRHCEYHARHNRRHALKNADLIILAGVVCDFRLNYGRALPPKNRCRIIALNRSSIDLKLNTDTMWKADLALTCDPCDFLVALAELVPGRIWEDWKLELQQIDKEQDLLIKEKAKLQALGHNLGTNDEKTILVNPLDLLLQTEDVIAPQAIIIVDGGDFVATAASGRPRGPLSWLDPGPFGTLGVGAGFALGAALCRPEAEIWLIWGDGSAGYGLIEFDTFARFSIPVIALVGNDAAWSQIAREQISIFNDDVACRLAYTRYDEAARALGGDGIEIRDGQQATKSLKMAKALAECGIPVLVNAHIGSTDFRDGSISV